MKWASPRSWAMVLMIAIAPDSCSTRDWLVHPSLDKLGYLSNFKMDLNSYLVQSTCRWSMYCKAPDMTRSGITSNSLLINNNNNNNKTWFRKFWPLQNFEIVKKKQIEIVKETYLPSTSSFITTEGRWPFGKLRQQDIFIWNHSLCRIFLTILYL